jgi:hypothetical protein
MGDKILNWESENGREEEAMECEKQIRNCYEVTKTGHTSANTGYTAYFAPPLSVAYKTS